MTRNKTKIKIMLGSLILGIMAVFLVSCKSTKVKKCYSPIRIDENEIENNINNSIPEE